jgi:hypothetical protein
MRMRRSLLLVVVGIGLPRGLPAATPPSAARPGEGFRRARHRARRPWPPGVRTPYTSVGVYSAGLTAVLAAQLTKSWVSTVTGQGWKPDLGRTAVVHHAGLHHEDPLDPYEAMVSGGPR